MTVERNMSTKVAVVTGGNKGIGFAIVKLLCHKFDGHVYLTARNKDRGKAALEQLKKLGLNPRFHELDIDDVVSISRLHDFLKDTYGGLDVLVNNAALGYHKDDSGFLYHQQVEQIVRTNYFSVVNVCNHLFPILRPHARIVNVSSSAGMLKRIPGEEIQSKFIAADTVEKLSELMKAYVADVKAGSHMQNGWGDQPYIVSKVGLTALTSIQQRAFSEDVTRPDIVVNAVHPGRVQTDMSNHKGNMTTDEGAEAPVFLALLPMNSESPKGHFVWSDKKIVPWDGPRPDS
ncbi:carbonyl reductase [NADPH] 1-like [Ornithodoros turicata]|uniref:carbonyl reductase [NADPH] 1-like n=1 Tax=Ornithodoros turicata TaxID=34597 RepID=UPI00313A1395